MVKTSDSRLRSDFARFGRAWHNNPSGWCAFGQRDVRSIFVIVRQILTTKTSEMLFVQRDHMIHQLTTNTADPAFSDSVLPRAPQTRSYRFDATRLQERENLSAELWSRSNSTKR
jgi:hypothetical protein